MTDRFIINNCLTPQDRENLIRDCRPLLKKIEHCTAYQTDAPIRTYPQFETIHKKFDDIAQHHLKRELKPDKSWFIMTNGTNDQFLMHYHPVDYAAVYYINSFPNYKNGTIFEEDGFIEASENSMLLFPGHLRHSAPTFKEDFERYTMSLNWNFKTSHG